jgi:alkylation response protein AidB-like acyl-CoA dehydrogenase
MDFALSAEQRRFAAALGEMLADSDGPGCARSWAAGNREPGLRIWKSLAQAGVTGLLVPAEHGGSGADPVDLVVACEEIGRHAVPGPVAESVAAVPVLLAGLLTAPAGAGGWRLADSARDALGGWLAGLAAGELIATLAAPPWVPYAADAEVAGLAVVAGHDSVLLGSTGVTHRSVDPARTLTELAGAEPIAAGRVSPLVATAVEAGVLACSAQLLGCGRALMESAVRHAGLRVQFGQPVGAFQAVKHQLANVLIGLEFARPLLYAAAISLATGSADTARDVSAAKVACADAASLAARVALQVHGAIGYTAEHDVSLWLTKVRALGPAWGSQAAHRARVVAALAGPGAG